MKGKRGNALCGFMLHPEGVKQQKGDPDIACKEIETPHTRHRVGQHSVTGSGPQSAKKMTEEAKMRAKKAMFEEEIKMCEEHVVNDEKRLLSHPPCCIELLHKELLECIEFIEWAAEMEMYRNDNHLCFSWLVDRQAPLLLSQSICEE